MVYLPSKSNINIYIYIYKYSFVGGEIVTEYVGELIRNEVADMRERQYEKKGYGDCYMFRIDSNLIVDATMYGGRARYINHSCAVYIYIYIYIYIP